MASDGFPVASHASPRPWTQRQWTTPFFLQRLNFRCHEADVVCLMVDGVDNFDDIGVRDVGFGANHSPSFNWTR